MKYFLLSISAFFLFSTGHAQITQSSIEGLWLSHEKNSVIQIYQKNGIYYGRIHKILKVSEDQAKGRSPEELEKGKAMMKGKLILRNLTWEDKKWINGTLLNPKNGKAKARCSMRMKTRDQVDLKIKKGLLTASKSWTRYEETE